MVGLWARQRAHAPKLICSLVGFQSKSAHHFHYALFFSFSNTLLLSFTASIPGYLKEKKTSEKNKKNFLV